MLDRGDYSSINEYSGLTAAYFNNDKIVCSNLHSMVNKVKEKFMFLAGVEARSMIRTDEPFEPEILQKLATADKSSSGYSTMDIYSDIDSRVKNSLENTLIRECIPVGCVPSAAGDVSGGECPPGRVSAQGISARGLPFRN